MRACVGKYQKFDQKYINITVTGDGDRWYLHGLWLWQIGNFSIQAKMVIYDLDRQAYLVDWCMDMAMGDSPTMCHV